MKAVEKKGGTVLPILNACHLSNKESALAARTWKL